MTMTNIIFIHHAPTKIDAHTSAKNWLLSEDSVRLCQLLAKKIEHYAIGKIYTSTEMKAKLTGQYISEALKLDTTIISDNLQETASSKFYDSEQEFRATVKLAMQNPDTLLFGDETFTDAKKRFSAQVEILAQNHPQETITIVTHGRILSMYLGDIMPENPEIIWERLHMPAYAVVLWDTKTLLEIDYSIEDTL